MFIFQLVRFSLCGDKGRRSWGGWVSAGTFQHCSPGGRVGLSNSCQVWSHPGVITELSFCSFFSAFFDYLNFTNYFIYCLIVLFIYFWLSSVFAVVSFFSSSSKWGLLSSYYIQASHCGGRGAQGHPERQGSRGREGFSSYSSQAQ